MRKLYQTIKQKLKQRKKMKRESTRAAIERIQFERARSRKYFRKYIRINGVWFNKALRPVSMAKAKKIQGYVGRLAEYKQQHKYNGSGAPFTLREHDQNIRRQLEERHGV